MAFSKKIRELVYAKYGGRCAYCGEEIQLRDMQVDHFKPLMRGYSQEYSDRWMNGRKGDDSFDNLMPSCRACNFRKGMNTIEQFRESLEWGINCCQRDFTYRMMVRYGIVQETPHRVKFYFEEHPQNEVQQ